jgi:hypothetical protein
MYVYVCIYKYIHINICGVTVSCSLFALMRYAATDRQRGHSHGQLGHKTDRGIIKTDTDIDMDRDTDRGVIKTDTDIDIDRDTDRGVIKTDTDIDIDRDTDRGVIHTTWDTDTDSVVTKEDRAQSMESHKKNRVVTGTDEAGHGNRHRQRGHIEVTYIDHGGHIHGHRNRHGHKTRT